MVQGGDITEGDGTGGMSIYGTEFEDENLGWRPIDAAGLVCMANRGENTNSSQYVSQDHKLMH
jgi:peptidyl-prolyl isomerase H (cyclophilin H)